MVAIYLELYFGGVLRADLIVTAGLYLCVRKALQCLGLMTGSYAFMTAVCLALEVDIQRRLNVV